MLKRLNGLLMLCENWMQWPGWWLRFKTCPQEVNAQNILINIMHIIFCRLQLSCSRAAYIHMGIHLLCFCGSKQSFVARFTSSDFVPLNNLGEGSTHLRSIELMLATCNAVLELASRTYQDATLYVWHYSVHLEMSFIGDFQDHNDPEAWVLSGRSCTELLERPLNGPEAAHSCCPMQCMQVYALKAVDKKRVLVGAFCWLLAVDFYPTHCHAICNFFVAGSQAERPTGRRSWCPSAAQFSGVPHCVSFHIRLHLSSESRVLGLPWFVTTCISQNHDLSLMACRGDHADDLVASKLIKVPWGTLRGERAHQNSDCEGWGAGLCCQPYVQFLSINGKSQCEQKLQVLWLLRGSWHRRWPRRIDRFISSLCFLSLLFNSKLVSHHIVDFVQGFKPFGRIWWGLHSSGAGFWGRFVSARFSDFPPSSSPQTDAHWDESVRWKVDSLAKADEKTRTA